MELIWDIAKDQINQIKHGVSFEKWLKVSVETVIVKQDSRKNYGEFRYVAYGMIDQRLYCLCYTRRQSAVRAISLRKTNNRELKLYEETINRSAWRS